MLFALLIDIQSLVTRGETINAWYCTIYCNKNGVVTISSAEVCVCVLLFTNS